ncbi:MAG TPA: CaiB/BaiF CoA-transferase family protein, partial [Actinomycetota bacterium]|nr:CaiB/BaiF CoA-transferase family protein [Actinomycetota bacterium]
MGPLRGVTVLEFAGIGPGPFTAMMLADMGADVIRIDRPAAAGGSRSVVTASARLDVLNRGRRSIALDLKHPEAANVALRLIDGADAIIEGFRPGVMERLGLGPDVCLERNPRLVYGRMTGWGQDGPLAERAGHDIDYIAIAGALGSFRRTGEKPLPPVNLVGDFGGGGLLLAFGIVAALFEASRSGQGQVVDAAMVDGAAILSTMIYGLRAQGVWNDTPGTNILDTGAPFYEVYETADERHIAVGALEPQFYAEFIRLAGLEGIADPEGVRFDRSRWPEMKQRYAEHFKTKTLAEWTEIFEGSDACVAPVLSMDEAVAHPHNDTRRTFVEAGGIPQPAPAPRFSRTPPSIRRPPPAPGEQTDEVLAGRGFDPAEIARLKAAG